MALAVCVFGQTENSPGNNENILNFISRRLSSPRKLPGLEFKLTLDNFCQIRPPDTAIRYVSDRVLSEYGAIFVGETNVFVNFALLLSNNKFSLVPQCLFLDEGAVQRYQSLVKARRETIGGTTIELEENAMAALMEARKQAATKGLAITPRGGSTAGRRSHADIKRLWDSRFYPALRHWVGKKISVQEAEQIKILNTVEQIARVFELEEGKKAFFSKDFTKSILYSVAPPGTSQHLFMLAIDIEQYSNKEVRNILASQGWYQTVKSDLPHFTYLGINNKDELLKRGLKKEEIKGYEFWTPKID